MEAVMGSYYWHRYSAAESFERILQGESPWVAFGDFLDDWRRSESEDLLDLVTQPLEKAPSPEEQHWAVFFAAAIEQLCTSEGFSVPTWIMEPRYYLQDPWYPTARKEKMRHFMEETTSEIFKQRKVFAGDRVMLRM
jgi:hypothetical protein